jgi:hypothetical protein
MATRSAANLEGMTVAPLLASRYCDICDGMPWWAQPLLVVIGLATAIAILSGLVRLSGWLSRRRRQP